MKLKLAAQQKMYDALHRIARDYETPEKLKKHADAGYGLDGAEAVEMAYENIQTLAADTIRGLRRPTRE